MLQWLLCRFGRHRIARDRIRVDRADFYGPCIGCGRRLFRASEGWRLATKEDGMRPADAPGDGRRG